MHKRNAIQLRLAISAAALCAVLAAATFGGAHRAGLLAAATALGTEPILARSISTIRKSSVEKDEASPDRPSAPMTSHCCAGPSMSRNARATRTTVHSVLCCSNPVIAWIGPGGNKGEFVGRSRVATPSRNRVMRRYQRSVE